MSFLLGNPIRFDEEKARSFFAELATQWRDRRGFYATLVPPQRFFMPPCFRGKLYELACYLFFQALTMRGGINSDDAFHINRELAKRYPGYFDPRIVSQISVDQLISAFREAARELQLVTPGENAVEAGTLSYKLEEHADHWIHNAKILCEHFDADPRKMYLPGDQFEVAYKRARELIKGMQRKIFALLTMWLQEFGLIEEFPLPIVVDFHCLRLLFQHEIVSTTVIKLGKGIDNFISHLWRVPEGEYWEAGRKSTTPTPRVCTSETHFGNYCRKSIVSGTNDPKNREPSCRIKISFNDGLIFSIKLENHSCMILYTICITNLPLVFTRNFHASTPLFSTNLNITIFEEFSLSKE